MGRFSLVMLSLLGLGNAVFLAGHWGAPPDMIVGTVDESMVLGMETASDSATTVASLSATIEPAKIVQVIETPSQPSLVTMTISPTSEPALPTSKPSPTKTLTPAPSPTVTPSQVPVPTIELVAVNIYDLTEQYAAAYGVEAQVLRHIAQCESGFNPEASHLGYAGLYQFSASAWTTYRTAMSADTNEELRFNAEEAIKTAAYILQQGKEYIWPNCLP